MPETTQVVAPAEPVPAAQVAAVTPEPGADGKPFDAARSAELIEKLRGEIKDLKPKAKLAEELTAAQQKQKDADLSDLEKANKKATELEAKLKAAELREMRGKVGAEYKLPAEISELLQGDTDEAMKEHAMKLVAVLPKQPTIGPTNPGNTGAAVTDAQRRAFLNGGPLPGV